jgi:hypothetical protein
MAKPPGTAAPPKIARDVREMQSKRNAPSGAATAVAPREIEGRHRELCVGVPAEQRTTGLFHVCCTYIALLLDLERE